jgi:phage-related protein
VAGVKAVVWLGSSLKDLRSFPEDVRDVFGYALYLAQNGGRHGDAKSLKGFGGAGVVEVVDDYDGDTYRCVYTVQFSDAIYVLHAFQKKSKKGSKTPKPALDLIRERLRRAAEMSKAAQEKKI